MIFLILMCLVDGLGMAFTIYLISLYFAESIGLLIVIKHFLFNLKCNFSKLYRKALVLKLYAIILCPALFARGASILFDLIVMYLNEEKYNELYFIDDLVQICFYFVENIPSIVIIAAVWRSYKENCEMIVTNDLLLESKCIAKESKRLVESDIIISNSFESDSYLKPLPKNVSYTDEDFRHMSTDNVPCIHSSDQDDNSKEKDQTTLKKSKSTS